MTNESEDITIGDSLGEITIGDSLGEITIGEDIQLSMGWIQDAAKNQPRHRHHTPRNVRIDNDDAVVSWDLAMRKRGTLNGGRETNAPITLKRAQL